MSPGLKHGSSGCPVAERKTDVKIAKEIEEKLKYVNRPLKK